MRQINGLRDTHTKKKQRRYSDENIQQKITATEGCTVMGQARYTHGIRTAHAQHIYKEHAPLVKHQEQYSLEVLAAFQEKRFCYNLVVLSFPVSSRKNYH